jgi:hypothetical protein
MSAEALHELRLIVTTVVMGAVVIVVVMGFLGNPFRR